VAEGVGVRVGVAVGENEGEGEGAVGEGDDFDLGDSCPRLILEAGEIAGAEADTAEFLHGAERTGRRDGITGWGGEKSGGGWRSAVWPRGGGRIVGESTDRAAVTGDELQGECGEKDTGLRKLIEVGETLDDRDAAAEQNEVNAGDLR